MVKRFWFLGHNYKSNLCSLCGYQEQYIYLIWNSFVRRISMLVGFTLHCHWPASLSFNSLIVIAQRWFAWDFYNMFSSIESGKIHNLPDILLWKKYFLCICNVQCCHLQIRSPRSQSTKPPMGHFKYSELLYKLAACVLNDWHSDFCLLLHTWTDKLRL